MEFTVKGVLAVVIPAALTVSGGMIDNSMKWRKELEQNREERQMQLVDRILDIGSSEQRMTVAEFYLACGVFTGGYRDQIELALAVTRKQHALLIAQQREQEERLLEEQRLQEARDNAEREAAERLERERREEEPAEVLRGSGWTEPQYRMAPPAAARMEPPAAPAPAEEPTPVPEPAPQQLMEQSTIFSKDF